MSAATPPPEARPDEPLSSSRGRIMGGVPENSRNDVICRQPRRLLGSMACAAGVCVAPAGGASCYSAAAIHENRGRARVPTCFSPVLSGGVRAARVRFVGQRSGRLTSLMAGPTVRKSAVGERWRRSHMAGYKLISADSHIVEPPDMYAGRIDPKFRDRAPKMERRKTPAGREYDAWVIDGLQVGTLGAVIQAGQRFEDPSQIDFLGVWEY